MACLILSRQSALAKTGQVQACNSFVENHEPFTCPRHSDVGYLTLYSLE